MLYWSMNLYRFIFITLLQCWAIDIYWHAWCTILAFTTFTTWFVTSSVDTCSLITFGANFWAIFEIWIALLRSSRQFCSFSIYCDLAWFSITEAIIFSTWVVTSSVETCTLTTFGANFWARGFVFSVHWATLLLIASGVSSKLFLKN